VIERIKFARDRELAGIPRVEFEFIRVERFNVAEQLVVVRKPPLNWCCFGGCARLWSLICETARNLEFDRLFRFRIFPSNAVLLVNRDQRAMQKIVIDELQRIAEILCWSGFRAGVVLWLRNIDAAFLLLRRVSSGVTESTISRAR